MSSTSQRPTPYSSGAPARVRVRDTIPSPSPMRILSTPSRNSNGTPARVSVPSSTLKGKQVLYADHAKLSKGHHRATPTHMTHTPHRLTAPVRVHVKENAPSPSPMRILATQSSRKQNQTPARVPIQSSSLKSKRVLYAETKDIPEQQRSVCHEATSQLKTDENT